MSVLVLILCHTSEHHRDRQNGQLRSCSKLLRSAIDEFITGCSVKAEQLADAIPFMNTLLSLEGLTIGGGSSGPYSLPANAVDSLRAPLTSISLTREPSPHSLTVMDLSSLLLPWNHSLHTLHLERCIFMAADSSLNRPGFFAGFPQLTSLQLNYLSASPDFFTALDLAGCTSLTSLDCSHNRLEFLEVTACSRLVSLDCGRNELRGLDLTACTALTTLLCRFNKFDETLNLSACTQLRSVSCQDNQLTSLDLSNCANLRAVACGCNRLTTLHLPSEAELQQLLCENNSADGLTILWNGAMVSDLCCDASRPAFDWLSPARLSPALRSSLRRLTLAGPVTWKLAGFEKLQHLVCSLAAGGALT